MYVLNTHQRCFSILYLVQIWCRN